MGSPICKKHDFVMTFGWYSRHPIFDEAQVVYEGCHYYCDKCVDEILPEYKRYTRQYKGVK